MLATIEKILFTLLAFGSLYGALRAIDRIVRIVRRGTGVLATDHFASRLLNAAIVFVSTKTVLKRRPLASLAHAFIAWGFTFYLLVNISDGLEGFGLTLFQQNTLGNLYRLVADVLTVGVLAGMVAMLIRRAVRGPKIFGFNQNTVLHPKALAGIQRDSLIVGSFILFHVGSRFLGDSLHVAETGPPLLPGNRTETAGPAAPPGPEICRPGGERPAHPGPVKRRRPGPLVVHGTHGPAVEAAV